MGRHRSDALTASDDNPDEKETQGPEFHVTGNSASKSSIAISRAT